MLPILLLTLIGYVYSQQMCVHNNQDKLTADHVVTQVANYADHDRNGKITVFEIISEFVSRFDTHPHDMKIDRYEFIYNWQYRFRDVPAFAEYLFRHLDRNHDNIFGAEDITPLYRSMDANHDGSVTKAEFRKWFEKLYKDCVAVPNHQLQ
ncbi:uncharacterized protein LOC121367683 isoform X2 [Gigantopelta aegis]|uniref:uncharacterized protein LOC121367683 isoform X2 n=1 Tax=Gigantopelta aegis TaxID=1735272 RepID=UPI001B888A73|nr:uncharacterized protein LOC121367683 isoform X2 [Gigantopelta aegis]